jgi:hypothetical protein
LILIQVATDALYLRPRLSRIPGICEEHVEHRAAFLEAAALRLGAYHLDGGWIKPAPKGAHLIATLADRAQVPADGAEQDAAAGPRSIDTGVGWSLRIRHGRIGRLEARYAGRAAVATRSADAAVT